LYISEHLLDEIKPRKDSNSTTGCGFSTGERNSIGRRGSPRHTIPVSRVRKHGITPPVQVQSSFGKLESEKDNDDRDNCAAIERRTRDVIELGPPRKVAPPNEILEDEAREEP